MTHALQRLVVKTRAGLRAARCGRRRAGAGIAFGLAMLTGLSACTEQRPELLRQARRELAVQNYKDGKPIQVAVVWNKDSGEFLSGAILGAEEINAEGGIAGRRMQLHFTDESSFLERRHIARAKAEGRYRNAVGEAGTEIAHAVTANPEVTAVIGHRNSEATLSAMLTYQDHGVMFFSGAATDSRILWSSQHLYFQMLPQDEVLVKKISDTLQERKWKNTYLVYAATRHNEQVAELLKSQLPKANIKLMGSFAVMSESVNSDSGMRRMQGALADIRTGGVDAIVLLAPPMLGAQVIRQSRALGVLQPFLGTGALDAPQFFDLMRGVNGDTLITSMYRSDNYQVRRFAERFKKRFPDMEANESAAMAYDSIRLYAEAVATAGATDPLLVAQALHYKLPIWYGLMGTYSFKDSKSTSLKYSIRKLVGEKGKPSQFVPVDDPA